MLQRNILMRMLRCNVTFSNVTVYRRDHRVCPCPMFCLESVQLAVGLGPQITQYKFCPEFVHVWGMSRVCLCIAYVQSLSKLLELSLSTTTNPSFVHRLSTSNVCPDFVKYKNLLFAESFIGQIFGQTLDFCIQSLSDRLSADQNLTDFWQALDRPCIWWPIGQAFDKGLTEIGQGLDFSSNLCPTNRSQGVPFGLDWICTPWLHELPRVQCTNDLDPQGMDLVIIHEKTFSTL